VYEKEGLCKLYLGWEPCLMVYKPETVEVRVDNGHRKYYMKK
jgi:hypothetical protein